MFQVRISDELAAAGAGPPAGSGGGSGLVVSMAIFNCLIFGCRYQRVWIQNSDSLSIDLTHLLPHISQRRINSEGLRERVLKREPASAPAVRLATENYKTTAHRAVATADRPAVRDHHYRC